MSSEDRYYVINGTLIHADQLEELYHAGRVGMQWGKHLPGTDWWKETTKKNLTTAMVTGTGSNKNKPTFWNKAKANLQTAGQAAKNYGGLIKNTAKAYGAQARVSAKSLAKNVSNRASYAAYKVKKGTSKLWNQAKGFGSDQINKLKEAARNAYQGKKKQVLDFFRTSGANKSGTIGGSTYLDAFVNTQLQQAAKAYSTAAINGGAGNLINSFIQTAQYRISKGVNSYLKSIGMDDEVDRFMSKFAKKKKSPMPSNANKTAKTSAPNLAGPKALESFNSNKKQAKSRY